MPMPRGSDPTIQDIIKHIDDGDYRIPRFQRNFVWDIKKSANLLDSIFKGFPISSVILWKTKTELPEIRDLGGISIPKKDTGRYTSYVIDGQQRLTSLYFALKGLKTGTGSDFSTMCISLTASSSEQIVFNAIPKEDDPDDYVILSELYTSKALGGKYSEKKLAYYQTLLQYRVSVIEIDDDYLQLDDVIEVFERLNLGGKKLNLFSIIAAKSYTPRSGGCPNGFDLAKKYESFNKKLDSTNYGKIDDSTFLQALAACSIGKVNKADILRDLTDEVIYSRYSEFESAMFKAIEHLKGSNYGVLVSNLLPYQKILVPFCYFHFKSGNTPITANQEKYLIDFFWRSILVKRYEKSAVTNMNTDISKIQAIIEGNVPEQEQVTLSPRFIFENGLFRLSSAFVTGMLCLMALQSPQSFGVGRTINITNDAISNSASKQYHHFFPQKSSIIRGNADYKASVNNIVNIVFMDAITNKQIGNRNPSDYIKDFVSTNTNLGEALESHYIDLSGYGIMEDDFFVFINERSKAMFNKLMKFIIRTDADLISETSPKKI